MEFLCYFLHGAITSLILRDWRGSSYDLNDAVETGLYVVSTTTVNSPSVSNNGIVQVMKGDTNQIVQTWFASDINSILLRRYNGSWQDWSQVLIQGTKVKPRTSSWADGNSGVIDFDANIGQSFASCIRFPTKNGGHIVLGVVGTQLAVGKYNRNGTQVSSQTITTEFTD